MPLPSDEVLLKTAQELFSQMQTLSGKYPGKRPAHSKGILLEGTFQPTPEAGKLSKATHFNSPSTPIFVRFSNSTGIPTIADNDSNADPRGMGIRFTLPSTSDGKRSHTDIVMHSTPFFPTRTGGEFLEVLHHLIAGTIGDYLPTHPAALAFVQAPKPAPVSYAQEEYFSVSAFKLIAEDGKVTFVRYKVVPTLGVEFVDAEALKEKDAEYLQTDIKERIASGPVSLKLLAQIAEEGDVTDDCTVHWPESRKVVELGTMEINKVTDDNAARQKTIIFDPIPRVPGVAPSDDPLLEMRAALYLLSGRERRAA
ncbi:hypothetical protein BP6252_02450 [Coleophoma cylindrospora]|uniref:Catalase core domain-containing protein n=1 Tax=Coleophoma cylindrospora TaxID=1849047 RepID=A0A3D8SET9_9HELO|nr:hypothetical protein BP6252_02450 [Coleophoma cylindrospora]